jgi:hypothetical protein
MLKNTSNKAIAAATLTAIFAMAGFARADDGGHENYLMPVAYIAGDDGASPAAEPKTCQDVREEAWFLRQLELTDGDFAPETPAVYCKADIYAESTVDAD